MKTNMRFSSYLPPFFLERKMFQTKFKEKITTLLLLIYSTIASPKVVPSM